MRKTFNIIICPKLWRECKPFEIKIIDQNGNLSKLCLFIRMYEY